MYTADYARELETLVSVLRSEISNLEDKLKAAETERDAALWQLRANAEELDRQ